MLIGKLKVRRIRYVKLYGMLLQYAFFCENEYVVNGWCNKKGNFSSPDMYIAYTKREVQPLEIVTICLKNLSRFFRDFDCVGHLAL